MRFWPLAVAILLLHPVWLDTADACSPGLILDEPEHLDPNPADGVHFEILGERIFATNVGNRLYSYNLDAQEWTDLGPHQHLIPATYRQDDASCDGWESQYGISSQVPVSQPIQSAPSGPPREINDAGQWQLQPIHVNDISMAPIFDAPVYEPEGHINRAKTIGVEVFNGTELVRSYKAGNSPGYEDVRLVGSVLVAGPYNEVVWPTPNGVTIQSLGLDQRERNYQRIIGGALVLASNEGMVATNGLSTLALSRALEGFPTYVGPDLYSTNETHVTVWSTDSFPWTPRYQGTFGSQDNQLVSKYQRTKLIDGELTPEWILFSDDLVRLGPDETQILAGKGSNVAAVATASYNAAAPPNSLLVARYSNGSFLAIDKFDQTYEIGHPTAAPVAPPSAQGDCQSITRAANLEVATRTAPASDPAGQATPPTQGNPGNAVPGDDRRQVDCSQEPAMALASQETQGAMQTWALPGASVAFVALALVGRRFM